ncbi:hypothetical protein CUMW_007080, partial [Citrus unshiu]
RTKARQHSPSSSRRRNPDATLVALHKHAASSPLTSDSTKIPKFCTVVSEASILEYIDSVISKCLLLGMHFLEGLIRSELNHIVRACTWLCFILCGCLQRLKEKAAFRNPDEFYFKMIKTKTVDGVHRQEGEANKYTQEELMLMKTQDIGYVLQKLQSERNKIEKLTTMLHSLDNNPSSRHVYFAEDREEAKEIKSQSGRKDALPDFDDIPDHIKRKTAASYRELEGRKKRVQELEKLYMDMSLHKELQKKGRKRKLREEEIVCPTSKAVYKWRSERKR